MSDLCFLYVAGVKFVFLVCSRCQIYVLSSLFDDGVRFMSFVCHVCSRYQIYIM